MNPSATITGRGMPPRRLAQNLKLTALIIPLALAPLPRPARADAAAKAPPQLAGTWKLNERESDGGGRHRRGGGGAPGEAGSGPPDGAQAQGDEAEGSRDSSRSRDMNDIARPPMMLLIERTDSTIVLSERGQTLQVMALGDPLVVGAAIEPQAPHAEAKWHGQTLFSQHTSPRGGTTTRTYELSKDGKQLTIVTRREMPGGRPPLELKRVYDHYEGVE